MMTVAMDRFEGRCWLGWRANPSADFGGIEVSVVITPTEAGWDAHGQPLVASPARRQLDAH
jgi:hypothetical protein